MSVATIDVTSHIQESYGSEGPRLAEGGGLPTRHNAPLTGPEKPDMASFANVDTESYGAGVFNGTSAATPHVAGMAALIKDYNPTYTADQIEQALISHASDASNDLGTSGYDNQYGWGRARYIAGPAAVDLIRFEAKLKRAGIRLVWETASEIDNLGFNVYRAEVADGPWMQLNDALIPSQAPGSPTGAIYRFTDRNVQVGGVYYYLLEDVDTHGQANAHGPIRVEFNRVPRPH